MLIPCQESYMREKICCVYKIKNLKNGKVYIGQSVHYLRRVTEHYYAELGRRHNIARTTISSLIRLGHC